MLVLFNYFAYSWRAVWQDHQKKCAK